MSSEIAVNADLVALFIRYAQGAGATVTTVANPAAAAPVIAEVRQGDVKCTAAVRDRFPDLYQALVATAEPPLVVETLAEAAADRSAVGAAVAGGTGLVVAHAGVAETGSLVLADQGLAARLVSMLTDVCLALLPQATILPNLDAAGALLGDLEGQGHRYLSLVTGPSRSGDI